MIVGALGAAWGAAQAVFWGALVLSFLVFIHEGGHFLAARSCGVRVTEFFLGLPCRFNLSRASRRIGTRFGVTPVLLGGYAAISGMEPVDEELAGRVLVAVTRGGQMGLSELAERLGAGEQDVADTAAALCAWGSIEPVYDAEKGEGPQVKHYASAYRSVSRDPEGNTVYDGRAFDRAHASEAGAPFEPPAGDEAFFRSERSRTYLGQGFWKRAWMLLAGIIVNICAGFLILVFVYSVVGVQGIDGTNRLGGVEAGSPAAQAGLKAGDAVTRVDGTACSTWQEVYDALSAHEGSGPVRLAYERGGRTTEVSVTPDAQRRIGISASLTTVRLDPGRAAAASASYVGATAQAIAQLVTPQHTMEVLDNSTSVVGISVMSAQAAQAGIASLLSFVALISFSLGFMNLLPIPPLDGGKLLIEVVQAVSRRTVPVRVQNAVSIAGIVLFGLLFVYMLRGDIIRFVL